MPAIEPRAALLNFVELPYKRPTGQSGTIYLDPAQVAAASSINETQCSVLVSGHPDWLMLNMSIDSFLIAIGAVKPTPGELPA